VRDILSGTPGSVVTDARPFDARHCGLVLVPDLLDKTPPFIEAVVPGSSAATAGLQPDDLVIAVAGRAVASRAAVERELGRLAAGDPVRLSVIRGGRIVECDLGPRPAAKEQPTP
jgi:serine protease Do